jgi:hypothetical protein
MLIKRELEPKPAWVDRVVEFQLRSQTKLTAQKQQTEVSEPLIMVLSTLRDRTSPP